MSPALRDLVLRYLHDVTEKSGGGRTFRKQSTQLLRAAERGQNLSGWGAQLRKGLERACDHKLSGGPRGFAYLVKALKDDGILARPWGRKCQFVFAELHHPDSPAIAFLCHRYGVTPESVLGTAERPPTQASSPPPTGRTPPTTPPAGAPTPAGREPARTSPPVSRSPASPVAPAPEPAPGGPSQVSADCAPEPPNARPSAPPRPLLDQPATRRDSPLWSSLGAAEPEDPFAAIQRFLSANAVPASIPTISVPPVVSAATPARPAAPVAGTPPDDDFMREEFLFLDRRILRSVHEPTDEDLQLEDGDGLPRGPPDEE